MTERRGWVLDEAPEDMGVAQNERARITQVLVLGVLESACHGLPGVGLQHTVDGCEIHFAPLGNYGTPLLVRIYQGIITPGFLRWCWILSIHGRFVRLSKASQSVHPMYGLSLCRVSTHFTPEPPGAIWLHFMEPQPFFPCASVAFGS